MRESSNEDSVNFVEEIVQVKRHKSTLRQVPTYNTWPTVYLAAYFFCQLDVKHFDVIMVYNIMQLGGHPYFAVLVFGAIPL